MTTGARADVRFDSSGPADAAALLAMVREFNAEDGHALAAFGVEAVLRIAAGEELARLGSCAAGARSRAT